MSDSGNEFDKKQKTFKPIRDYLEGGSDKRSFSIGVLATAIEEIGIYTWDRFGRFGKVDKAKKEKILGSLARIYKYENDPEAYQSEEHPLDYIASFPWEDPYSLFGWPIDEIPDFEEIARLSNRTNILPPKPQAKAGDTKKHNTYLIVIGALCKKLDLDINSRGVTLVIQGLIHELGTNRDVETIRTVLTKAKEAINTEIG